MRKPQREGLWKLGVVAKARQRVGVEELCPREGREDVEYEGLCAWIKKEVWRLRGIGFSNRVNRSAGRGKGV